jgi:formate C-acetyltransferase
MTEENIRLREEINEQMRALKQLEAMAKTYGFDISTPAKTAQEAIQWTYFAYLACHKAARWGGNVTRACYQLFRYIY